MPLSQVTGFDAKLLAHGVKGTGFQFVFRIANNGVGRSIVKRLMASLAARCIQCHGHLRVLPRALSFRMNSFPVPLSDVNVRV